jgi:hypothetical protein
MASESDAEKVIPAPSDEPIAPRQLGVPPKHVESIANARSQYYLSLARETAKQLPAQALIWTFALVAAFLLIDAEIGKRVSEIEQRRNQYFIAKSKTTAKLASEEATRIKGKDELEQEKKELAKIATENINFSLPGLTQVPLPPSLAPAVWSLTSLIVITHLLRIRRWAHGYLALALMETSGGVPVSQHGPLTNLAVPARWLLEPLPSKNGVHITVEQFTRCYGWERSRTHRAFGIATGLGIVCLLQLRMLWLQTHFQIPELPLTRHSSPFLELLSLATLGATIAVAWLWVKPWRVPDRDFIAAGQVVSNSKRREFLLVAASALLIVVAVKKGPGLVTRIGFPRKLKNIYLQGFYRLLRWNPRYRRHINSPSIQTKLQGEFALNVRSKVIHRLQSGFLLNVGGPKTKPSNFKNVNLFIPSTLNRIMAAARTDLKYSGATQRGVRARKSYASWAFESAADSVLGNLTTATRKAEIHSILEKAFRLFEIGIRVDLQFKQRAGLFLRKKSRTKPRPRKKLAPTSSPGRSAIVAKTPLVSSRLYDRFARIAIREGRRDKLQELLTFIEKNSLWPVFETRPRRWIKSYKPQGTKKITGRSSNVG